MASDARVDRDCRATEFIIKPKRTSPCSWPPADGGGDLNRMWKGRHRDLRGTGTRKEAGIVTPKSSKQQQKVHSCAAVPTVYATFIVPHLCSSATAAPSSRKTASLRCNVGRKPYVRSGRASCSSPKADSEFKPSHAVTPAPAARCHASSFSRRMPRWLSSVYCRRVCITFEMVAVVRAMLSRKTPPGQLRVRRLGNYCKRGYG